MASNDSVADTISNYLYVGKRAFYSERTGVMASATNRPMPSVLDYEKQQDKRDYSKTGYLTDENIYLAFYPKKKHSDDFFSGLELPNGGLDNWVDVERSGKYRLAPYISQRWGIVEEFLRSLFQALWKRHRKLEDFPAIVLPRLPSEFGYEHLHSTRDIAVRCAVRSYYAFKKLFALVSFTAALWSGDYQEIMWQPIYDLLQYRRADGIPLSLVRTLKDSELLSLSLNARPGGFLDARRTRWLPMLKYICRFAPVYLVFGTQPPIRSEFNDPRVYDLYWPPDHHLRAAMRDGIEYELPDLPEGPGSHGASSSSWLEEDYQSLNANRHESSSSSSFTPAPSNPSKRTVDQNGGRSSKRQATGNPWASASQGADIDFIFLSPDDAPEPTFDDQHPPPPPHGPGQQAGETFEQFRERMQKRNDEIYASADVKTKQVYDSYLEASKNGPTKKSNVYEWQSDDDPPDYFVRTALTRSEREDIFYLYAPTQRLFLHAFNSWDLCRQLPDNRPIEEQLGLEGDETLEDFPFFYDPSRLRPLDNDAGLVDVVPVVAETEKRARERMKKHLAKANEQETTFPSLSVKDYLSFRHGYDAEVVKTGGTLDKALTLCNHQLMYVNEDITAIRHGIVDFCDTLHNLARNQASLDAQARRLGPAWDFSPETATARQARSSCKDTNLSLSIVDTTVYHRLAFFRTEDLPLDDVKKLYIVRPSSLDQNPSEYLIATADPTTVLFLFRSAAVQSIRDAVKVLLRFLIPFRLVLELPRGTSSGRLQPRLPHKLRPMLLEKAFKPDYDFYLHYVYEREKVLGDVWGPAVRSLGGIAGRLAYDVVSVDRVLEGPRKANEVIGWTKDWEYVADHVPMEVFDAVCGMYWKRQPRLTAKNPEPEPKKVWWWPKQDAWRKGGRDGDHWTPHSEGWYQKQLESIKTRDFQLWTTKDWRAKVRTNQKTIAPMLQTSRRLAEVHIENDGSIQSWR